MLDFKAPHDSPTVLLIDDDMVSREVMATILTMSGYSVHTAADGAEGVGLLTGEELAPSVILMDAQMDGLSGTALIQQLRAHSNARLYVISASNPSQQVLDATDGFLLKPFAPEALTRMLEEQQAGENPPIVAGLDPDETIVNPETLAQLREMMPDAAVRQIFVAIVTDLGRRTSALEAAIARADWPETRRIGHAIKGGGSMAGAMQIARLGALLESGALQPSPSAPGVNQVDNSAAILQDLRTAALNLRRMLDCEFKV